MEYTSCVALEDKKFETMREALADMVTRVKERLDAGGMSLMVLETACWVVKDGGLPMYFYDARDLAHEIGVMEELGIGQ